MAEIRPSKPRPKVTPRDGVIALGVIFVSIIIFLPVVTAVLAYAAHFGWASYKP